MTTKSRPLPTVLLSFHRHLPKKSLDALVLNVLILLCHLELT